MNTNLQEREYDGVVAEGADSLEASRVIKGWLDEQDAERPFGIGWTAHRKIESELKYFGFAEVNISKLETHDVFILKGKVGTSGCASAADFEQVFKKVAKMSGIKFQSADAALSFSRGRFQAVIFLPDEAGPTEIAICDVEQDETEII